MIFFYLLAESLCEFEGLFLWSFLLNLGFLFNWLFFGCLEYYFLGLEGDRLCGSLFYWFVLLYLELPRNRLFLYFFRRAFEFNWDGIFTIWNLKPKILFCRHWLWKLQLRFLSLNIVITICLLSNCHNLILLPIKHIKFKINLS